MKWYCCGNGQSVTIGLFPVSNTLDCMHDQKFVIGGVVTRKTGSTFYAA